MNEETIKEMTEEEFTQYLKDNAEILWVKYPPNYLIITKNGVFPNYKAYPPNDNSM
jgi:hypothetical protein